MSFNKLIKGRVFSIAMFVCLMAVSGLAFAQGQLGETVPGDKVAADTAQQINSSTGSIADTPVEILEATDDDASTLAAVEEVKDNTDLYKSVSYYLLLFFLLCVFLAIIGKVLKVYELTSEIHGKKGKLNWNKIQGGLFAITLVLGLYGTYWSYKVWGNMSSGESASEHGLVLDSMMLTTIVITTIVFVITQILLFGFAFRYSANDNRKAYFYPHNNFIERLWTIIPALALTVLVLYGFFTWRTITSPSEDAVKSALNIEITGEQFKWNVRYAGENNELGLRNYKLTSPTNALGIDFKDPKSWDDRLGGEIVLPVNKPVRFTIRSKDVLHSFYMPEFRAQINAVPGMPTFFQLTPRLTTEEMREKTGNAAFKYTLLCAKICGAGHYNMQYTVKVVSEKEYAEWIVTQPLFFNDDVKKELKMADNSEASANNKLALNK
ncbi:cytochrome c oxidase subunit II [Pedobacter sp. P351]|uniref:cytochrome c oxidase subunit II n=1 Tax=Pedobacter superstes TaxID=3133441 RepID=UPI0030B1B7B3